MFERLERVSLDNSELVFDGFRTGSIRWKGMVGSSIGSRSTVDRCVLFRLWNDRNTLTLLGEPVLLSTAITLAR